MFTLSVIKNALGGTVNSGDLGRALRNLKEQHFPDSRYYSYNKKDSRQDIVGWYGELSIKELTTKSFFGFFPRRVIKQRIIIGIGLGDFDGDDLRGFSFYVDFSLVSEEMIQEIRKLLPV